MEFYLFIVHFSLIELETERLAGDSETRQVWNPKPQQYRG